MKTKNKASAMYVHIPFCKSICSYCDFAKVFYNEEYANKYIDILLTQIKNDNLDKLSSIYVGGGTPSALNHSLLERLLKCLSNLLSVDGEFCVEVNPETIDEEKMKLFANHGVNRLSIGVQTFDEKILKLLNRKHSLEDVKECVRLANKYNISNYSFDFIYGIYDQRMKVIKKDLEIALSLNPKHLSLYSLMIEKHTKLYIEQYPQLEEEKVREMYDYIYEHLTKNGFDRYEVSNFSLPGYESRHNLVYWKNKEYCAYGLGASAYLNGVRTTNTRSLNKFLNGEITHNEEVIGNKEYEFEYIMLRLRLEEGIDLDEYNSIFKENFLEKFQKPINKLVSEKLLLVDEKRIKASYEGFMLLNRVILEIVDNIDKVSNA